MEIYSSTTRFALACNNSTKIIEPIQSRCAVIRYSRLSDDEVICQLRSLVSCTQVLVRLTQVCGYESISYDSSGLEALIFTAEGDLRTALNGLQATVSGFGHVTSTNVFKVCDQPHPLKIKAAIEK